MAAFLLCRLPSFSSRKCIRGAGVIFFRKPPPVNCLNRGEVFNNDRFIHFQLNEEKENHFGLSHRRGNLVGELVEWYQTS